MGTGLCTFNMLQSIWTLLRARTKSFTISSYKILLVTAQIYTGSKVRIVTDILLRRFSHCCVI